MVDLEDLSENDRVQVSVDNVEFIGVVTDVQSLGVAFEVEKSEDLNEGGKTFVDFSKDPELEVV